MVKHIIPTPLRVSVEAQKHQPPRLVRYRTHRVKPWYVRLLLGMFGGLVVGMIFRLLGLNGFLGFAVGFTRIQPRLNYLTPALKKTDLFFIPEDAHEIKGAFHGLSNSLEYVAKDLPDLLADAPGLIALNAEIASIREETDRLFAKVLVVLAQAKAEANKHAGDEKDTRDPKANATSENTNAAEECRAIAQRALGFAAKLNLYAEDLIEISPFIEGVAESARQLLRLINQEEDRRLNANVVIKQAIAMNAALAQKKGLKIIFNPPANIPEIFANANSVRQVLINLINNAIVATAKGSLTIDVEKVQGSSDKDVTLRITLKDTGKGMSPETLALNRSGKKYHSGDDLTKKGTGLGIAICKRLVEENLHGHFDVQSKLNEGSTFTFTVQGENLSKEIPAVAQPAPRSVSPTLTAMAPLLATAKRPLSPIKKNGELAGKKILFAEDGVVDQKIVTKMLDEAGATCIPANNGQKAVEQYTADIDVVITDMQMPLMDGIEVAKKIRLQAPHAIIIALTANDKTEISSEDAVLFSAIVTKPFKPAALRQTIVELLRPMSTPADSKLAVNTTSVGQANLMGTWCGFHTKQPNMTVPPSLQLDGGVAIQMPPSPPVAPAITHTPSSAVFAS